LGRVMQGAFGLITASPLPSFSALCYVSF